MVRQSFTWSGSDDTTPPAQLVYEHRLLNPDSPLYGWSDWSSSTTATYPRSPDSRLPDGTYRFQVKAKDADGAIQPDSATWKFTIGGPTERVPVIVIPGIMGSELFKIRTLPDKRLWPDVVCPHLFTDADDLKLGTSGQNIPGVSVYASDLLRHYPTECLGWIGDRLLPQYDDLIYYLEDAGYPEAQELFVLPYDWRKDLRIAGVELARLVNQVISESGASKVDIVAHSMGGLVARYYINSSSSASGSVFYHSAGKVRKLILLGTPSFGSPDAFQALHPELGRGRACLSDKKAQELSANWPSTYQLLPTVEFFELYTHIFDDRYGGAQPGPLIGSNPVGTWNMTYLQNEDSKLNGVNEYLLKNASFSAYSFHNSLGNRLIFNGETYIIAGSGTPTKLVFTKRDPETYPQHSTPPSILSVSTWFAEPTNGDGTVPLRSVTELSTDGPLHVFHSSARHSYLPKDQAVKKLILYILTGDTRSVQGIVEESSVLDGSRCDQAFVLANQSIIIIKSPVELHAYDSEGGHIGPDTNGVVQVTPASDYFTLGNNTIAFLPMDTTYSIELLATESGVFGLEILETDSATCTRTFSYEDVEVTSQSRASLQYIPNSADLPSLDVDKDGDGSTDAVVAPKEGNTPLGIGKFIEFKNGSLSISFSEVVSAGHTVCKSFETLEGLAPSFRPVTPFYFLSTSASVTGPVSITIQYDEDDVPTGRGSDLKLYRISGEDAIEDITLQLDQAANTVTGQTDGFSYFVVGYMSASPETNILSPTTGDTVTGQSCTIHWQTTDPDQSSASLSIDLFYSTNGGSTWTSISSNEANDGVYDWNISALQGGEYWLKLVAGDSEGGTSEATTGPFTIVTLAGNVIVAPNPVTSAGTTFFYTLPDGTSTAKLMVLNVTGRLLFETPLDVGSTSFPSAGTWNPVDQDGIPLANGPYIYVLIADGKVIGQGKMVIQR